MFSIFPEAVDSFCAASIVGRARRDGLVDLRVHDLRSGATDPHRTVDDAPFGGGAGMVLAPEPVFAAVELAGPAATALPARRPAAGASTRLAAELAGLAGAGPAPRPVAFSLLCGRYEGVDQRIADHLVDGEISIGDFVLAGGELAALVIVEAALRLVPGVLGNEASAGEESFTTGCSSIRSTPGRRCSGAGRSRRCSAAATMAVERWRRAEALWRTLERRPDLIEARGDWRPTRCGCSLEHGYPLGADGTERVDTPDAGSGERRAASGHPSDRPEERDLS